MNKEIFVSHSMDQLTETALISSSPMKQDIARGLGAQVIDDPTAVGLIKTVEDAYFANRADSEHQDGLLTSFLVPSRKDPSKFVPLPIDVTIEKAEAIVDRLKTDSSLKAYKKLIVNDSVWVAADENGNILEDESGIPATDATAINKTDPNKNGGDVERLTEFFRMHKGRDLYSIGCNAVIDTATGEYTLSYSYVKVGSLRDLDDRQIEHLLRDEMPKTRVKNGAFNIDFIMMQDGLVVPKDEKEREFVIYEGVVDTNADDFTLRNTTFERIKNAHAGEAKLRLSTHGFHHSEENVLLGL